MLGFWFSPIFNVADDIDKDTNKEMSSSDVLILARELAEWILADALTVRFQLHLHKIIWVDTKSK